MLSNAIHLRTYMTFKLMTTLKPVIDSTTVLTQILEPKSPQQTYINHHQTTTTLQNDMKGRLIR